MKSIITILMLALTLNSFAAGEDRTNAINISSAGTQTLNGVKDANTITWFKIEPEAFGTNNMLTITLGGGNYGYVSIFNDEETDATEDYVIGGSNGLALNPTIKKYHSDAAASVYVAISQENKGGTARFTFSVAQPGETREVAIKAQTGSNTIEGASTPVWYSYTAPETKIVAIETTTQMGNAVNVDGKIECISSLLPSGFRMQEGNTVYIPMLSRFGSFNITLSDIQPGMYADMPIDITNKQEFELFLPADPTASDDSSAQSERYWIYTADKSGFLMWGTYDANWIKGMWGCAVRDTTEAKTLNTPDTKVIDGMITYTIPVVAGHTYLISPTVCYNVARTVTIYAGYQTPSLGDTKDDPFILSLGNSIDLGRKTSSTKYYSFTAEESGVYTATVHAAGQVRATTPKDGSWTIRRDYSIQDKQMHIDDEIELKEGETLLLEITLTSDIDIHVDGSDADTPNYFVMITKNDGPAKDIREGEDIAHAIDAEKNTDYAIMQSDDEDFYEKYYRVDVHAGDSLVITTSHKEAISSPSCISLTLDGSHWNDVKHTNTIIRNEDGTKSVGRRYVVAATPEDRTIYIVVEGVFFLYEGATWSYNFGTSTTAIHTAFKDSEQGDCYNLSGQRIATPMKSGIYIMRTSDASKVKKVMRK